MVRTKGKPDEHCFKVKCLPTARSLTGFRLKHSLKSILEDIVEEKSTTVVVVDDDVEVDVDDDDDGLER